MPIVLQIVKKAAKLIGKVKQSKDPFKIYSNTPNILWTKDKTQKKRLVKTLTNKAKKK